MGWIKPDDVMSSILTLLFPIWISIFGIDIGSREGRPREGTPLLYFSPMFATDLKIPSVICYFIITMAGQNLLLKTLIEGTIVIYASRQVIAWVLGRGCHQEGEQEEHCLRDLGQVGQREQWPWLACK